MKLVQKIAEVRHFLALLVLAVGMSVFAAGAGKAAVQPKSNALRDPVIGSMTWEQANADNGATTLSDGPFVLCDPNCPRNCNGNCDSTCNTNCNKSC
jgi:hypothetical protein